MAKHPDLRLIRRPMLQLCEPLRLDLDMGNDRVSGWIVRSRVVNDVMIPHCSRPDTTRPTSGALYLEAQVSAALNTGSTATVVFLHRSRRSTRSELAVADRHQSDVIAALLASGHPSVADRLARCRHDRQHRRPGHYPWRCRSPGCWACRRMTMRRWWQGFQAWLGVADTSLLLIPLSGAPLGAVRRLRKGLRDVRDRAAARRHHGWAAVAMAGLLDGHGGRALVLVRHIGISRVELWSCLERRWPTMAVTDPGDLQPSSAMTMQGAAMLAQRRRGIEPMRIIVLPQIAADAAQGAPMPVML